MILWTIVIVVSVLLDQITKVIAASHMALYDAIPIIENVFSFHLVHNYGAAWGIFSNHRWVFITITAIAILLLPVLLYRYRKLHFLFGFALSLIIAGAIGNMIDRVFRGYVIDFLEATFIDFPVFNVADICVTVGAALMFFYILFIDKTLFADKPKKTAANGEDARHDVSTQEDDLIDK